MSTKIYNAYLFKGSLGELFELKTKLQNLYKEQCKAVLHKLKDYEMGHIEDFRTDNLAQDALKVNKGKKLEQVPYYELMDILRGLCNRGFHHPLNFSASVVVYYQNEKMVVQFFGLNYGISKPSLCQLLVDEYEKSGKLIDFHYQNQTEQPEDITDEEWRAREKFWDAIFDNYLTPAQAGFVNDFDKLLFNICYEFAEELNRAKL